VFSTGLDSDHLEFLLRHSQLRKPAAAERAVQAPERSQRRWIVIDQFSWADLNGQPAVNAYGAPLRYHAGACSFDDIARESRGRAFLGPRTEWETPPTRLGSASQVFNLSKTGYDKVPQGARLVENAGRAGRSYAPPAEIGLPRIDGDATRRAGAARYALADD
jgi:hypothetical protein